MCVVQTDEKRGGKKKRRRSNTRDEYRDCVAVVTAVEDFLARCLFQLRQDLPVHSLFASVRLMVYDLQRDWNSSEPAWSSTASSMCRMYVYRHNSSSTAYQPRIETKPDSFQRSKSSSYARFCSTWLSLHPSHTHAHTPHTQASPQAAGAQRPETKRVCIHETLLPASWQAWHAGWHPMKRLDKHAGATQLSSTGRRLAG